LFDNSFSNSPSEVLSVSEESSLGSISASPVRRIPNSPPPEWAMQVRRDVMSRRNRYTSNIIRARILIKLIIVRSWCFEFEPYYSSHPKWC